MLHFLVIFHPVITVLLFAQLHFAYAVVLHLQFLLVSLKYVCVCVFVVFLLPYTFLLSLPRIGMYESSVINIDTNSFGSCTLCLMYGLFTGCRLSQAV